MNQSYKAFHNIKNQEREGIKYLSYIEILFWNVKYEY
jgi:hypothetical protein